MQYFKCQKYNLALLALLLSGCSLSPMHGNLADEAAQMPQQITDWSQFDGGTPSDAQQMETLSSLIQSEQLSHLLEEAFSANPSLQQTLLTLRVRKAEVTITGAGRLPGVDAGYSAAAGEDSNSVYTGSLNISWEVDLWQKLGIEIEAAQADVAQQAALYQAARDSLAAQVMTGWLRLTYQQHVVRIQQQRVESLRQSEQLVLQRFRNGLDSARELDSARSALERAQATLVDYRETLAQQHRALRKLLGRSGGEALDIAADYPEVILPLADMPQQTLQRRPDLVAAYQAIQAASQRSAAAYKDLLPSISIQAALDDVADSPSTALLYSPLWSLLGQLTAPLYRGGQLKAEAKVSDLNIATAYESYRDTLLTAVNEVEDALGQERSLTQRQSHLERALASARNSLKQYRQSYRVGLINILDLLQVEQNTYDLQAQLAQVTYLRLANRVDLGLALGLPAP